MEHPALGAVGVANPPPVLVFLRHLDREPGLEIAPGDGVVLAGTDP
jgi:hypothetical protein